MRGLLTSIFRRGKHILGFKIISFGIVLIVPSLQFPGLTNIHVTKIRSYGCLNWLDELSMKKKCVIFFKACRQKYYKNDLHV